jgi:omega-amidase
MFRAHLVQSDIVWEDRPANYALIERMLADARPDPGDLVLLPELFDTGFSFSLPKTADHDGQTLAAIRRLARHFRVYLQGSRTVIGPDGRGRNRCSVADPAGTLICEYDKVHPFSFGRETEFFSGGSDVRVYDWAPSATAADSAAPGSSGGGDAARVCPAICYDLRFPELFRLGMRLGAEVLALGANWPAARAIHRRALSIARAIENQAYMLCVNRAGRDPHLEYAGGSLVVDPKGQVVAELGPEAGVLSVPLDLTALRAWRRDFPACRDARLIAPPMPASDPAHNPPRGPRG